MPTYDYECRNCGHRMEVFQSIKDNPLRKCKECGRLKLKRLIGAGAGIIFKGSGFYETDYRSDSYNKAKKSDSASSDSKGESKGESKTDKGAAKGESKSKPEKKAGQSGKSTSGGSSRSSKKADK